MYVVFDLGSPITMMLFSFRAYFVSVDQFAIHELNLVHAKF